MTDTLNIYEVGSDEFTAFQRRLAARALSDDMSLGGKPGELLQRAQDSGDSEFAAFATAFYEGLAHTARATVERVIQRVETMGDEGVRQCARLFDGQELPTARIQVNKLDLMKGADGVDEALLKQCTDEIMPRLRKFHEKQREASWQIDDDGGSVGVRVQPLRRVGLYIPGGTACYPSTLMMTYVAAQVAGVEEIAVFTPPETLEKSPLLCALLNELGINEVFRVGGAQAIAAAAIGTEKIARVDKIVGPGNIFVAIAKQMLSGRVGIDSFAGPSEIVVVFDASSDPALVAADMLAQAEHDGHAAAIGITDSAEQAEKVKAEVAKQLADLPRKDIIEVSLRTYGGILCVPSKGFAFRFADSIAPEHLELHTEDAENDAKQIKNAGAIFIGPYAPESFGDYNAGPNHTLPTAGSARWASALSVRDFVRHVSIIRGSKELLAANKDAAIGLARAEQLEAHARSLEKRFS
ncbi:MAG: histidinol dehydrogenase [Planctomycetes bacterium]|nr:histidinol dehydrogenase [Planctomycetota bacterium]